MKTMKFVLGNSSNPNNGEIRDSDGVLWNLRAVMNKEDERVMRAMEAAPEILEALIELTERVERIVLQDQSTPCTIKARAAIAKATA